MRLAAKLILLFLVGLLLIVAAFSFVTLRRERQMTIEHHQRYAEELAELLAETEKRQRSNRSAAAAGQREGETARDSSAEPSSPHFSVRGSLVRVRRVEMTARDSRQAPSVPADRLFVSEEVTTITMMDSAGREHLYTYVPIEPEADAGDVDAVDGEGAEVTSSESEAAAEETASPEVSPAPPSPDEHYEVSAPDIESDERLRHTVVSSLLTLLSVAGLSALVILFGGIRMVGRPLNRLIDKVNRVSDGDLADPVEVRSGDELGDLAVAINQMCDCLSEQRRKIESETEARIAAVEQLRHADRLRSLGRIAAGIAHEIGTPLNVVAGHAELIESGELSADAVQKSCRQIKTESDRIAKIISNVLDFARQRSSFRQRVDLREIVDSTCELLQPVAAKAKATLKVQRPDEPVPAHVDRGQIQQVLTNLINNAIQSRPEGAGVTIRVDQRHLDSVTESRIAVSDNGTGIAPEDQEQIFEPFFTTKDVGKGTGLGLAISHGIIHEHGGEIRVQSELGQGSTLTVVLRDRRGDAPLGDAPADLTGEAAAGSATGSATGPDTEQHTGQTAAEPLEGEQPDAEQPDAEQPDGRRPGRGRPGPTP